MLSEFIPALQMQEQRNSAAKADSSAKSATSAAPVEPPSGSPHVDAATNPFATPSEDTSNPFVAPPQISAPPARDSGGSQPLLALYMCQSGFLTALSSLTPWRQCSHFQD